MTTLNDSSLSLYRWIDWHNPPSIFSERPALLAQWSETIETHVIEQRLPARIYVGFQQQQRIVSLLPRYRQMAEIAESLTVFGLPAKSDFGLNRVPLRTIDLAADDPLVDEWFLIVNHPHYARALVAREVEPRRFHGIYTTDPTEVERFEQMLVRRAR